MAEMSSQYNPAEHEAAIYERWLKSGYFNPDKLPGERSEPYTIMIAPPNITGSLHMGHALENTISDVLIRYHRLRGYRTLWVPGTDHAGIATQNVVEKDLKKQGLSRHDLGRDEFLKKIWEWRDKYGDIILDQLKTLGCSCDWSRTRFTMDENYQRSVKAAFEHYHKQGLIYQGERVINWCIKDQTALSDLELEYEAEEGKLWHLAYPIKGSLEKIVVATTRPETMLGDTAVAVNPKDKRYEKLVGKLVVLPLVGREIPIIADHAVDMEFGTGAVKVTPAHDMADSDMALRNGLPFVRVINEVGKIVNVGAPFDGLKIAEARGKVLMELSAEGVIVREEKFTHNVAKCYRCGSTVEPMLSKQWFMKMKPLAEKALKAMAEGKVKYQPARWEKVARDWLLNVRDWCISRQIWWGHEIPIPGSADTFDTWFSSALWPFATLGWPDKTKDLETYYPTALITSARDILHLWISRMIFSGLEFMGEAPFGKVIVHATVLTKDGKRMSKSLGTGIDPLQMIGKYGADATRFGLLYQSYENQEIRFNEQVLAMGRKFCNKLWNIARFTMTETGGQLTQAKPVAQTEADEKILAALATVKKEVEKHLADYNFGNATHALYDFIWHDLADIYIEASKAQLKDDKLKAGTQTILLAVLTASLKLLHPFMPFVTEAIWDKLAPGSLLLVEKWPK